MNPAGIGADHGTGEEIYRLDAGPYREGQLLVHSFRGREALSRLYRFDVVVTSHMLDDTLERTLLGQRAVLSWQVGRIHREFHGIVSAVEAQGLRGPHESRVAQHRLRLVPRAWVLGRRKGSRIFQDMRADQVIAHVLREAGVPSRFRLERAYPVRSHCTQYAETDLELVLRLAAESGMFFYFEQPHGLEAPPASGLAGAAAGLAGAVSGLGGALGGVAAAAAGAVLPGEVMVFCDTARAYPALGDDGAGDPADRLAGALADEAMGAARSLGGAALGEVGGAMSSLGAGAAAGALSSAVGAATDALGGLLRRAAEAPVLHLREAGALSAPSEDSITQLTARRALRASVATFSEYDPERPQTPLVASAQARGADILGAASALAGSLAAAAAPGLAGAASGVVETVGSALGLGDPDGAEPVDMEVYEHGGPYLFPDWQYVNDETKRILKQSRRRMRTARGESHCARLHAGRRFTLADHPVEHLDREWAITSVEHRGVARPAASEKPVAVYRNTFECVPADVPFVPPRPPQRTILTCLTATVAGPPGEEIHVNSRGEIKVRFHWDRSGRGENSSCWIRTMHAWGGAGWGTQLIPRVGMEVVVAFDGGDPDKPIVLGSLHNATHPPAFPLPGEKTKSGIRTRSTPRGGTGHNELSFEDASGSERIYLRAERDFDSVVERHRTARVQVDDRTEVLGRQTTVVHGAQETRVSGDRTAELEKDDHLRVRGARHVTVDGDAHERVVGMRVVRVEGRERTEVSGDRTSLVHGELVHEVRGAATMLVGRHDAKRSCTLTVEGPTQLTGSDVIDLASDAEIVLRCGESSVRIAPGEIEIASPKVTVRGKDARLLLDEGRAKLKVKERFQVVSEDEIVLKSSGASLALGSEAKLDGSKVLLNSPEQASDDIEVNEPEVTTIELVDQDDNPIPYQRFRILLDDGSHYTGFLDDQGKAEVDVDGGGEIVFPDLADIQQA